MLISSTTWAHAYGLAHLCAMCPPVTPQVILLISRKKHLRTITFPDLGPMTWVAYQIFENTEDFKGFTTSSGSVALPEDWLLSDSFSLAIDLNSAVTRSTTSSTDGPPVPKRRSCVHIHVKVHLLCEQSRGTLKSARQASLRASEELHEATSGAVGVRPRSIGRSLSR
jgi:hypothetical protein